MFIAAYLTKSFPQDLLYFILRLGCSVILTYIVGFQSSFVLFHNSAKLICKEFETHLSTDLYPLSIFRGKAELASVLF